MTKEEKKKAVICIKAWETAAPYLEAERRRRIREDSGTPEAIADFDGMLERSLKTNPPKPVSGLVEQQAWFHRLSR